MTDVLLQREHGGKRIALIATLKRSRLYILNYVQSTKYYIL